eukprot:SM000307S11701  [mRNA]  locus=s307:91484:92770:- [translate_table: standard]
MGKSSLLLRFTADVFDDLAPTIGLPGPSPLRAPLPLRQDLWPPPSRLRPELSLLTTGVDFKLKMMTIGGKRLKLTVWDTAGQERFRTLTGSYYRGAQGIILVYDVTRRETFIDLSEVWLKEIDLYSTNADCIKMLVGNKVDRESERMVTRQEGVAFARQHGCLFLECSAKTRDNVAQCFEELVQKILEMPSLVAESAPAVNLLRPTAGAVPTSSSCSC